MRDAAAEQRLESLLRELTPQVIGALVRRYGDFETCEDATQEALLAAAKQWPDEGLPDNPKGWLITAASRRRIEMWRSDDARRRREEAVLANEPRDRDAAPAADDTLTLLLLCCHPALTRPSQVALTLRAVGGLTTAEIARAFLVPEATIAQRISRAKKKIKDAGAQFAMPPESERVERIAAVLQVLYLVFNEGYTASSGSSLARVELSDEAIRLVRQLHQRLPADGEVQGLLSLMLLTDARRPARATTDGSLVRLADQDRSLWNHAAIEEGVSLVSAALAETALGPYQVQAAIAAVHDEAASAEETDWPQILALYDILNRIAPGPMVTLNRIVALAEVYDAGVALHELDLAVDDASLATHHRLYAVRAHLLEQIGDHDKAAASYERAAKRTLSIPEQNYLRARARSARRSAGTPD